MHRTYILLACALMCACSSFRPSDLPEQGRTGREIFFSDSLNAFARFRTYPEPETEYTPAPKGYKPVYISSYARHGSRKMLGLSNTGIPLGVMECADSLGLLTPLGKEVRDKAQLIEDDMRSSIGDLTEAGVRQHKGIAERMYRNYRHVFRSKGTPVRFYSTPTQRTMLSMFACNEELMKHAPGINSTRQASDGLTFLISKYDNPQKAGKGASLGFISEYFETQPFLDRLFTGDVPALKDTLVFIENLYNTAAIVYGLDIDGVDFAWDLFTPEELFILEQSANYQMYVLWSNSPQLGDRILDAIKPMLKDFTDRADTALAQDVPGADLRFGHDIYLMSLLALIGVDGYVTREDDPLKVIDTFRDFAVAPVAGNLQMVFYRDRRGDVLVKFLHNEIETWIPIDTDMYPYYHWADVREYFTSLIEG